MSRTVTPSSIPMSIIEYHEDENPVVTKTFSGLRIQPGAAFTHAAEDRGESSVEEGSGVPGGGPDRTEDTG